MKCSSNNGINALAELHNILDDRNKKISLKEYQEILYKLKNETISCATREEFELQKQTPKYHWYQGETNGFQIALDLSEHINSNQKAIECLKEIKRFVDGRTYLAHFIDDKIKELEKNNES